MGKTPAEVEVKRVETLRKERRESKRQKSKNAKKSGDSSSSSSSCLSENEEFFVSPEKKPKTNLYPKLPVDGVFGEEQAMPNIRVDRLANSARSSKGAVEKESLFENDAGNKQQPGWKRILPSMFKNRTESQKKAAKEIEAKLCQLKKEEQSEKLLAKRQRKEKKRQELALLRERAREERSRKNFADAVDLLLTYCRLLTSFAVLVGNVHKTFLPRHLAPPRENIYDSPDLLMIFGVTLLLDVGFFWLLVLWNFFQQLGLCCRLGCCHFVVWVAGLLFFGGFCMLYPMHFIHEQLDAFWCQFEEGEPLSQYFDG